MGPCSRTPPGPSVSIDCINRPNRNCTRTTPLRQFTSCNAEATHRRHRKFTRSCRQMTRRGRYPPRGKRRLRQPLIDWRLYKRSPGQRAGFFLLARIGAIAASLSIAPKDNLKCRRPVAKTLQRDATLHAHTYWVTPHPSALFPAVSPESKNGRGCMERLKEKA